MCKSVDGHAEAVQVLFDPSVVSYETLVNTFFANHDPTTLDRQGLNVGSQYRSVIFFHDPEQEKMAHNKIRILEEQGIFPNPIVTQVLPLLAFWRAEEHHQRYYEKQEIAVKVK